MIRPELRLAVFAADIAEAVLNEKPGGGKLQYIHHVDMTTRERPINPRCLQDVQLVGSINVHPAFAVGDHFSMLKLGYELRTQAALTEIVGNNTMAPERVKVAD